jgi:uncharacterized protein YcfL
MKSLILMLPAVVLAGCASVSADSTVGSARVAVNTPALVEELGAVRSERQMTLLEQRRAGTARLSLLRVLEHHVPAEFQVYPDNSLDLNKFIRYDLSQVWTESFVRAMDEEGIDVTINATDKTIRLVPRKKKFFSVRSISWLWEGSKS